MTTYTVQYTNINLAPIKVNEQSVDTTSTDISLFGYIRLKYGDALQENLVHLLENFACPEDPLNPGNPDTNLSFDNIFDNSINGQFWYNTTKGTLYVYTESAWTPISSMDDVAANWGSIFHGEQIPKPVSPTSGQEFEYNECIWCVAPATYDTGFSVVNCATDNNAIVTMEYGTPPDLLPGTANYLIIGIKGNQNKGSLVPPPLPSGITPTPTPTYGLTPTVTPTVTSTPDFTPTVTPTSTVTPTVTAEVTPTPSPQPLGINTRLYTAPSPGDPGAPGPGGTGIRLYNTCGPSIQINQVEQPYYVSLQDLSGGNGPYQVIFRWIVVSPITGWYSLTGESQTRQYALPPMTMDIRYYGGVGSDTSWLRTNLNTTSLPYVKFTPKFDNPDNFDPTYTYRINYTLSGWVILIDAEGNSVNWYIPREPTPVGGSNNRTPTDWELPISYGHYEHCDECPDCL
jgi:hypothetical protein